VKDVARIIGVVKSSIYRWLQMRQQPQGLTAKPHPGPTTKLSREEQHKLETLLRQGAQAHGWPTRLWTTQRIATLIERQFGVRLHHDHVGRFLRQRLRWTPQKPRRRARERDEAAILHWQTCTFPRIAQAARQRGAHLVFLDESGFMLTPTVRRTWAPRGRTPILDCWDRRDRISAISCVTVSPIARRLNLYFDLLPDNANATGADIVDFLRQLKAQLRGPLTVIWDGSNIHSKSRLVQAYLARHPEIVVKDLPGYAPELNPDEGVWGWSKYGRLANLAATDTDHLRDQVFDELTYAKGDPLLLTSFFEKTGLSFAA
jgi:transposase